jgi:hypothetical protein
LKVLLEHFWGQAAELNCDFELVDVLKAQVEVDWVKVLDLSFGRFDELLLQAVTNPFAFLESDEAFQLGGLFVVDELRKRFEVLRQICVATLVGARYQKPGKREHISSQVSWFVVFGHELKNEVHKGWNSLKSRLSLPSDAIGLIHDDQQVLKGKIICLIQRQYRIQYLLAQCELLAELLVQ